MGAVPQDTDPPAGNAAAGFLRLMQRLLRGCSSAFSGSNLKEPGHARSGLSHDELPPLRPITWMPAAREELPEDLHNTNITLSAPPAPVSACDCGVNALWVSRVVGFQ